MLRKVFLVKHDFVLLCHVDIFWEKHVDRRVLCCKCIIAQRYVLLFVCLYTITCIFRTSKIYCGLFWYWFSCRKKKSKIKGWNMKPWTNSFISRYPSNVDIKIICCTVWWYQIYSMIYGILRKVFWCNIIPLTKDRTIWIG